MSIFGKSFFSIFPTFMSNLQQASEYFFERSSTKILPYMSSSMWASNLTKTIKHILSMKQFDLYSHINHIIYTELFLQYIFAYYTPRKQSLGVYRNHPVLPSVRPSMYLVSGTLTKLLIGFL